jgi:hypothetical protein
MAKPMSNYCIVIDPGEVNRTGGGYREFSDYGIDRIYEPLEEQVKIINNAMITQLHLGQRVQFNPGDIQ